MSCLALAFPGNAQETETLCFSVIYHGPGSFGGHELPRGPVAPPVVAQDGSTLYILGGCDEADLVILDGEEEEVYTDTLQGTYQLQIRRGQFTFVTEIEL